MDGEFGEDVGMVSGPTRTSAGLGRSHCGPMARRRRWNGFEPQDGPRERCLPSG
jgi:hypothetical protein